MGTSMSRAGRELDRQRQDRRADIGEKFRARHPDIARQERGFRKAQAAAQRDYGHKVHGTVETHQKAAAVHQGTLARMFAAGHLSIDQLASSQSIRSVAERIGRDVAIGTCSLETRVDCGRTIGGQFFEKLGAVRAEIAYGRWRRALRKPAPVLAMIVDDVAVETAATLFRMRRTTARALLVDALDAWPDYVGEACREVEEADLLAMQAGLA